MKKKILSIILCLAMLVPAFIFPIDAVEPLDARQLQDKGQKHFYLGEAWAASTIRTNGTIDNGEYTVSTDATIDGCPATAFSDVKFHFAHDNKALYIGFEAIEQSFGASTSGYTFNINVPVAGGMADAASYLTIPTNINSQGVINIGNVAYVDNNSGSNSISRGYEAEEVVSGKSAKHDSATKKTVVEIAINIDAITEKVGFVNAKEIFFSADLKSKDVWYHYRLNIDADTKAAISAAYPARALPANDWVPHVIHFEAAPDVAAAYDFYTLDGASVKMADDGNAALRFETVFKKSYIEKLKADNPGAEVYVGTMIIEADYLKPLKNVFNKETISAYRVPIKITEVYADINNPLRSDADTNTYAGSIRGILNGATEYAAIGFVNIAGKYTYSPTYTRRAAAGVATTALRDLSSVASEQYGTQVLLKTSLIAEEDIREITAPAYCYYSDAEILNFAVISKNYDERAIVHFWDVQPKVEGTVRIVSSNIYFHNLNWHYADADETVKKAIIKRNADFFEESQGDVLLLQEVSNGMLNGTKDYRVQDRLNPMLEAIGYKMVDAKVGPFPAGTSSANFAGCNYTPIWYNPEVVTLEASEHNFYRSVRINPDGGLSSSKGFTWALFTEKATGKKFIAASTHLTYHGDATMANKLRQDDAEELVKRLGEVSAQYNAPIIVGGDFNCGATSAPYSIIAAKYQNVKSIAKVLLNGTYATVHAFPSAKMPKNNGTQIDFIFVSRDAFDVRLYQTMLSYKSLIAADHIPTSIDFKIK
ncbi:MAG: hypothetical protein E7641_02015 [Ruminococcaceae bacterium]|nr:hypothetical protein [Oscillospiraceae bacterium]